MNRGDLFVAELRPRSGSEQQGVRPVVVVSHDSFNTVPGWRSIVVVPVTTSPRQSLRAPTVVALPQGTGGLASDSVAIAHQITTLDRSKLRTRIGSLPQDYLEQLERAIAAALDLPGSTT